MHNTFLLIFDAQIYVFNKKDANNGAFLRIVHLCKVTQQ